MSPRRGPRRLRRLRDDLTGRAHQRIVRVLQEQVDAAVAGVDLARQVTAGTLDPGQGRTSISEVEHRGDRRRSELARELSAALTTPVDREDLFRLSRSVDDVLDNLRDYVRETDLYRVLPGALAADALERLRDGLAELHQAVGGLDGRTEEVTTAALTVRKHAGRVRQLYQRAMADLFDGDLSADVLKQRELLRRLDVVGLRLSEAADAMSDAILKRSV